MNMTIKTAEYFYEKVFPPSEWLDRMTEKIKRRKLKLDDRIFRFMSIDAFEKMIRERHITFKRPELWKDPYENYFFRHKIHIKDDLPVSFKGISDKIYAMCWTANVESEAFWRLQSKEGTCRAVRIESTVKNVLSAIHDAMPSEFQSEMTDFCSAGKVLYRKPETIDKTLNRNYASLREMDEKISFEKRRQVLVNTVFEKRRAFKYEEEIRFVFDLHGRTPVEFSHFIFDPKEQSRFDMPFDFQKHIKGIMVDPYTTEDGIGEVKRMITNNGLHIKVEGSLLNRPHPSLIAESKSTCRVAVHPRCAREC